MCKHKPIIDFPLEEQCNRTVKEIYELLEALHDTHLSHFADNMNSIDEDAFASLLDEEKDKVFKDLMGSGKIMTEPIFYGGTGAYDFQYRELTPKKYQYDTQWIQARQGFSLTFAADMSSFLKRLGEDRYKSIARPSSFDDYCKKILNVFCFTREDVKIGTDEEVVNFLNAFTITPGSVNQHLLEVGQYNSALSHPIIKLDENHYFLPVQFFLAQSLYESPFYWMGQDSSYKSTAFLNRGNATEDMAYTLLLPVFGLNLYKDITIKKTKAKITTDIDILAVAGNKAVIIQAKSKRLTELSRRGNTEQLKKDFGDAIQKAYDQGVTCRDAILNRDSKFFKSDGTEIKLEESIDDAYVICLTSDEYPALTYQVNTYLQKAAANPFPVAMNVFDLDILTFYLKDPFEFLYYLRQRTVLSEYFIGSSEMALLGFHIKHKLFPRKDSDLMLLEESYAQLIDANFPVLRGYHPKTEAVQALYPIWKSKKFEQLIQAVMETRDPGFTDAIFFLYDLAGNGADKLIKAIEFAKNKTKLDKKAHDFSLIYANGESGISFISQLGFSLDLGKRVLQLSVARKYKTKATTWLGIGSIIDSNRPIDVVVFNKEPWEYNKELEELSLSVLKKGIPMNKEFERVGRNEACPCGSGKKYKRCCGKN